MGIASQETQEGASFDHQREFVGTDLSFVRNPEASRSISSTPLDGVCEPQFHTERKALGSTFQDCCKVHRENGGETLINGQAVTHALLSSVEHVQNAFCTATGGSTSLRLAGWF